MLWVIGGGVILALVIFPLLVVTGSARPHTEAPATPASERPQAPSTPTASNTTPNAAGQSVDQWIKVRAEFQAETKDGKQKVVVYIHNENAASSFAGSVDVQIKGPDGGTLGRDTFYPDNLPPQGQTYGVIWARPGGAAVKFSASGSMKELPAAAQDQVVDIAATVGGVNYQTFHVVVADPSTERLIKVAQSLRVRYPSTTVGGFEVFFYGQADRDAARAQSIDKSLADYSANYKTGLSELFVSATGEKVVVK